jgi:hypothetical protein
MMAKAGELDHLGVPWETVVEDGMVKIRPQHDAVPEALKMIGAANPFMAIAFTVPDAQGIMQRIVDLHNAELTKSKT